MANRPFASCTINVDDQKSASVIAPAVGRNDIRASSRRRVTVSHSILLNTYSHRAFSVAGPYSRERSLIFYLGPGSQYRLFQTCIKNRMCSLDTNTSSTLGVLNDNALYKSTYLLTYLLHSNDGMF